MAENNVSTNNILGEFSAILRNLDETIKEHSSVIKEQSAELKCLAVSNASVTERLKMGADNFEVINKTLLNHKNAIDAVNIDVAKIMQKKCPKVVSLKGLYAYVTILLLALGYLITIAARVK